MTTERNVNVTIKLNGLTVEQRNRLDQILGDKVVTDMEMQEILAMKLRPGMIDAEKARLEKTRREVESLRKITPVQPKSNNTSLVRSNGIPMPYSTKQKLTWLAIVGPSVVTSLSILLGGLL